MSARLGEWQRARGAFSPLAQGGGRSRDLSRFTPPLHRCGRCGGQLLPLPNSSKAGDIKLAVPLSEASAVAFDDDPFLSALRTSKDLAEVGIKVVPTGSKDALDDVLSGRSEASLVSLGAFEN